MKPATFNIDIDLNPGFCPYTPEQTINNLYKTQFLLSIFILLYFNFNIINIKQKFIKFIVKIIKGNKFEINNATDGRTISYITDDVIPLPGTGNFSNIYNHSGFR